MSGLFKNCLETLPSRTVFFSERLCPFPLYFVILGKPLLCDVCCLVCEGVSALQQGFLFHCQNYRQRNPQRSQQLSPSSRNVSRSGGSSSGCGRQRSGMANGCPERTGRPLQAHKKQKELVGVPLPWNWDLCLQIIFPCTSRCLGVKEKCLECFGLDTSFFSSASATSGDMSLPGDDNINFCLNLYLTILILLWQATVLLTGVLPSLTPWELAL